MKYFILLLTIMIMSVCLHGQSPLYYAYGNISLSTDNGDGTYNVQVIDLVGGYDTYPEPSFDSYGIKPGFALWAGCVRHTVVTVVSQFPLVIKVSEDPLSTGALGGFDMIGARIAIIEEIDLGGYPYGAYFNVADGNSGAFAGLSPFDHACIRNYYVMQLKNAIETPPVNINVGAPTIATEVVPAVYIDSQTDNVYYYDGVAWNLVNTEATDVTLEPDIDTNGDGTTETTVQQAIESLMIWGIFVDDYEAATNSVPIGGIYEVAWGSTVGTAGELRRRRI